MTSIDNPRALLRRLCIAVAVVAAAGFALSGGASVSSARAPLKYSNPIRNGLTGKPLSCPDPSVIRAPRGKWDYFLVCTSDNARNAFPIWKSEDLVHWYPNGYVFPRGHQPGWAVPSDGHGRDGIYWAPALYRIQNRWTLYFSAVYNARSGVLGSVDLKPRTMVLGVATADSLAGPWHTKVLHYPGQLNAHNAKPNHEVVGGDIDPGVVRDPRSGQLYLFWAEQREQVWHSELSSDGLTVGPDLRIAFSVSEPWECDPANKLCTVEGPQAFYRQGRIFVLYSAASTWDSSYAVGVASSTAALNPSRPFVKAPRPILRSGNGFLGPGGESDPVVGPDGSTMILYHALLHPLARHNSGKRYLMLSRLNWIDGLPLVGDGVAR